MSKNRKRMSPIDWFRDGDCIRTKNIYLKSGYPAFFRNGKLKTIARMIATRRHGELPSSVDTRHTCDNRWCINPDHIIIGSRSDNVRDMMKRGRHKPMIGQKNGRAKLTPSDVLYIRESGIKTRNLCEQFGVCKSTINYARSGYTWRNK
jgi:hypothetical protein